MRKSLLTATFLLFTLLMGLVFVQPPQVTHAANCSSSWCKKYNEWSGGTTGGWEEISMDTAAPTCNTGCSWIHRGLWAKNSGSGDYVFAGVEKTQSGYDYNKKLSNINYV